MFRFLDWTNGRKVGKIVKILTIPAETTGMIQPLDVYTFRPWKNFLHFSYIIILYNYDSIYI